MLLECLAFVSLLFVFFFFNLYTNTDLRYSQINPKIFINKSYSNSKSLALKLAAAMADGVISEEEQKQIEVL